MPYSRKTFTGTNRHIEALLFFFGQDQPVNDKSGNIVLNFVNIMNMKPLYGCGPFVELDRQWLIVKLCYDR